MNADQIRSALAGVEASITQVTAAFPLASNLNDITDLNNRLVSLKAERTRLQLELVNLEAAGTEVAPLAMTAGGGAPTPPARSETKISAEDKKRAKAVAKELDATVADRDMVTIALGRSQKVLEKVRELRSIGSEKKGSDAKS
jgi:hypothetical protein